ncbi:MAG: efflux RND transporter periplasmic adaptor subunit [Pirellulales bacterium]|nr:efflux RND transporter periplasmic adaptor subunit [Pirellulales bacterium]
MNHHLRLLLSVCGPFTLLLISGVSCSRSNNETATTDDTIAQPLIETIAVQSSPLDRETELSASIEGEHRTEICPRIEGIVSDVYVKLGDQVKKGQLLIRIKAPGVADLVKHREELVKEAEAEIKRRSAGIRLSEAEVRSKEASIKIEKIKKDRMEALVKRGSLSKQRLDEAIFEVRSAEADLEHAHAQVEAAQADFEVAEAKKEVALADLEAAITQANHRDIHAPFEGLVAARHVDPGDYVEPSDPNLKQGLLDLVRNDQVRAVVYVPLEDAAYVEAGDPVILRHKSYTGTPQIDSLGGKPLTISRKARAFNRGTRMMRTEIDIDNTVLENETGERLVPGDYGKVRITLEDLKGKPMIPRRAILTDENNEKYLVVLDKDLIPQKVPVDRILLDSKNQLVIESSSLKVGQRILSAPDKTITLGEPIDLEQLKAITTTD